MDQPAEPGRPARDATDLHRMIRGADLTPAERSVAAVVLHDYPRSALLTAGQLAATASVSAASVSRFAAKLGFGSFAEVQEHLREELRARLESPSARLRVSGQRHPAPDALLVSAVERDIDNLRRTLEVVNGKIFEGLVARLARSDGRIYVGGSKKARILADYLAIQLNQVRGGVTLLKMDDTLPDSILDVGSRDVLVVLQPRRATAAIVETIRLFQAAGAAVAVMSDEQPPPILARVDYPIPVVIRGISAFDSWSAYISIINAIVAALMERAPVRSRSRIDRLEGLNAAFSMWYDPTTP